MNINLRKAAAGVQAISAEISALKSYLTSAAHSAQISVYEDVAHSISDYNKVYVEKYSKFISYTNALLELRSEIRKVNGVAGVDDILAAIANIDHQIYVSSFIAQQSSANVDVLIAQHNALKAKQHGASDAWGNSPSDKVSACVLDEAFIKNQKDVVVVLKRRKRQLQDSLLEKNVGSSIEISTHVEEVLTELAVI